MNRRFITHNKILFLLLLMLAGATGSAYSEPWYWKFRPGPPPERYGNILISRVSDSAGVKPASFSHWMHRLKYTCWVCHTELGFKLKVNTTLITEDGNRNGKYCGACHNGEIAFGHSEDNCHRCHNGDIDYGKKKFNGMSNLPSAAYGNGIDWVEALKDGLINPASYFKDDRIAVQSNKMLTIYSGWMWTNSHVQFSHEIHGEWLGCSNCHPAIFKLESETTQGLSMLNILKKEYCGVCHGTVAFPLNNNCRRCHPTMHR